jgi:hypothetical protein
MYKNGDQERGDTYVYYCGESADTLRACNSEDWTTVGDYLAGGFNEALDWIDGASETQLMLVDLYDGAYRHLITFEGGTPKARVSRQRPPITYVTDQFWPKRQTGTIVEDAYAQQHGWICLVGNAGGTFYFDPLHDYICRRWVQGTEDDKPLTTDVVELAQTVSGQWYGREVVGSVAKRTGDALGKPEITFKHRCYLHTDVEVLSEVFDADNLPG